jgi:hypothetical protein
MGKCVTHVLGEPRHEIAAAFGTYELALEAVLAPVGFIGDDHDVVSMDMLDEA